MIYIIAAASGTGKTHLVNELVTTLDYIMISISYTTRPRRPNERDGENYFFINEAEFKDMIQKGKFLEYAKVFGNYYGTSRKWVEAQIKNGLDVILEIDWQGAQQIKKLMPHSISIFILPPSIAELRQRLLKRNQDAQKVIDQRIAAAHEEIAHCPEFDYIVVNDKFAEALLDLRAIIHAQRLVKDVQVVKQQKLLAELTQNR
jgi:guanylate kinase